MLAITSQRLTVEQVEQLDIDCDSIDYASIMSAKLKDSEVFDGCQLHAAWAVAFRPAEDIIIPVNLCDLHFNALKIGIHEGVTVDNNILE